LVGKHDEHLCADSLGGEKGEDLHALGLDPAQAEVDDVDALRLRVGELNAGGTNHVRGLLLYAGVITAFDHGKRGGGIPSAEARSSHSIRSSTSTSSLGNATGVSPLRRGQQPERSARSAGEHGL